MNTETTTDAVLKASFALYETPAGAAAASGDLVMAKLEDLVVGRTPRYPIYNESGMLLLAEGAVLTNDFKHTLEARSIGLVQLHKDDLPRLTFHGSDEQNTQRAKLDEALVERIDKIVDSGIMLVVNSEAAISTQMTHHGCNSYQRETFLKQIGKNKETSIYVDNLMRSALRGKKINSSDVTSLAASYLDDITSDIDSTLASKMAVINQSDINDHCVGMAILGMALGVEMGMDAHNVRTIAMAGLIHDWGMASVPQDIREAKRYLDESEFFEITKHPMYTQRMLEQMSGVSMPVPIICYQVHERPNGTGYPQGRFSDRIHPMAKILAVADAYNALISPRPYRPPLTPYAAMECILRQTAAGEYDPYVVRALLMVQSLFPIGSYVVLSNGNVAKVLRRNGEKFTQPIVKIVQDSDGNEVPDDAETAVLDLSATDLEIIKSLPTPGTNAVQLSPEIVQWRNMGGQIASSEMESSASILQKIAGSAASEKAKNVPSEVYSLEHYSEKYKRLSFSAFDLLEGSRKMTEAQYSSQRQHQRTVIKSVVTLQPVNTANAFSNLQTGIAFQAMTYDVSKGGISFIYPAELSMDTILVGLPTTEGKKAWFLGNIVRRREIGDTTFWLHSVVFQQRVSV
jgi:HD-GYP domain-containing protein (c-di-GMP phosphodiesterase class II)